MTTPSTALAGAMLLFSAASAGAQEPYPECQRSGLGCGIVTNSRAPEAVIIPTKRVGYRPIVAVRAGTPILFELRDDLTAQGAPPRAGQRIRLIVAEPVRGETMTIVERPRASPAEPVRLDLGPTTGPSGIVLVPRGSHALAEIEKVRGRIITIRLLLVRADGRDVLIRGRATIQARPGALAKGVLQEDIVPAQALLPHMVPDFSRARVTTAADLPGGPSPPPPPPGVMIVEPARARAPIASYITPADYPPSALASREQGTVAYTLDIGVNGRVSGCTITRSSGSSALDSATCRLIVRRARFTPAIDSSGSPAASRMTQETIWQLPTSR